MLQLENVTKQYVVADTKVDALKGISVTFRDSEFVSILGPSGCGKTTLLNIIGGLDHYTTGDLVIDGISTKEYKDRDWDTYRNHRIGFVFQSYNLIPHQTILENVELALNIAGVAKEERVRRSKQALDEVGLKDQYHKRPNQLSGGQCQRVAIARALVNEPEILLADEPTGALDTTTSIQIMDLIKKISEHRLVIMVTHNPELAQKYSTRIIRLLDGKMMSDSNPLEEKETEAILKEKQNLEYQDDMVSNHATKGKIKQEKKKGKKTKSKLAFWSAFKLSARNLKSKFKRTLMVCIAGSIGIIGVASVLAVSTGVQNYIESMQDDMLSGNPITIDEEAMNLAGLLSMASNSTKQQAIQQSMEDGKINVQYLIEYLVSSSGEVTSMQIHNDLTQDYIEYVDAMPEAYYSAIAKYYGIDITNNIYTSVNLTGQPEQSMSLSVIKDVYLAMLEKTEFKDYAPYITSLTDSFMQAPNNADFIASQYDIISDPSKSHIATKENEIMIVVSKDQELSDILLAQLGYYSQEEFFNIIYRVTNSDRYDESLDKHQFDFDELLGKSFTWYPNDTVFTKSNTSTTTSFTYSAYENSAWDTGKELTVTAILRPKENISYGCLTSGFYYTEALTQSILESSLTSEIVQYIASLPGQMIQSSQVDQNSVSYTYSYTFEGTSYEDQIGYVGQLDTMGSFMGLNRKSLSIRHVGGVSLPNSIHIYPVDFAWKDQVTAYLDVWNSDQDIMLGDKILTKEDRNEVVYTDNLSIIISLIHTMIDMVTTALVAFTALSLVVSTVMIAIITYVSVIERVKEIGVIRSLGGRKKDVSRLFNAETFMIGGISGLIGIIITYILSAILNVIVGSLVGIYTIAHLPILTALILIIISIVLTSISGVIPARIAAKKDPVDALRSE